MSSLQSPTASAFRKVEFTDSHVQALNILSFNHVKYLAEEVLYCFGEFDSKARPISYKVNILVDCSSGKYQINVYTTTTAISIATAAISRLRA